MKDSLHQYLRDVAASRPLTVEEEKILAARIKKGDMKARAEMVEANLRFVISIAVKYQNRGLPLGDLISAGNIGLITAAERFEAAKGVKFISYAVWWIRQAIQQALADYSRMMRLPVNRIALLRRISEYTNSRRNDLYPPAEEDIADALDVPVKQVIDTLAKGRRIHSLDARCGEDDKNSLLEIMSDESQEPPDALLLRVSLKEEIEAALDALEEREREIIRLYFGLDGAPPMTLNGIGNRFGLTRERIRQIRDKALCKLRHPARALKLMPYAEGI